MSFTASFVRKIFEFFHGVVNAKTSLYVCIAVVVVFILILRSNFKGYLMLDLIAFVSDGFFDTNPYLYPIKGLFVGSEPR